MSEKHKCGSRPSDPHGVFKMVPAEDEWRTVGRDRVCSYCGSLHFDDFMEILEEATKPDGRASVDVTGKGYKVYAKRAETSNASEGGIKFYGWHLPKDLTPEELEKVNRKIHEAFMATLRRSDAALEKIREAREKESQS